jgi:hypothetical protein
MQWNIMRRMTNHAHARNAFVFEEELALAEVHLSPTSHTKKIRRSLLDVPAA